MTGLSRRGDPRPEPSTNSQPLSSPTPPWHVLCILPLASGCFFFLPLIPVEENMPPEIISSYPAPDEPLVLGYDPTFAFVMVEEPNGDPFECWWYVPTTDFMEAGTLLRFNEDGEDGGETADTGARVSGCQVNLFPDPDYENYASFDGKTLYCDITDQPTSDVVRISWPIDFIGEGT